ncbi:MAG: DUF3891 family protein [Bryobacterales bacterium]
MLKRPDGDRFGLVTQPDHAALSGFLAAHWGNDEFAPAGHWDPKADHASLQRETVFGIAQHDNGWWEWEADPELDPSDGLPLDFLSGSDEAGFERWARGAARFERSHPFASLLINRHAYWLQSARVAEIREAQFRHPLFGFRPRPSDPDTPEAAAIRDFLIERLSHERVLLNRLARRGGPWPRASRDETLLPAVRLLQTLDTVSLAICGGARKPLTLLEIPRKGWSDRVTIELEWSTEADLRVSPFPFDVDPLPVSVPARFLEANELVTACTPSLIALKLRS